MAEVFKSHSVDFEFITNPDWGHVFDMAGMENRAVQEAFDQILIFLGKYVK